MRRNFCVVHKRKFFHYFHSFHAFNICLYYEKSHVSLLCCRFREKEEDGVGSLLAMSSWAHTSFRSAHVHFERLSQSIETHICRMPKSFFLFFVFFFFVFCFFHSKMFCDHVFISLCHFCAYFCVNEFKYVFINVCVYLYASFIPF